MAGGGEAHAFALEGAAVELGGRRVLQGLELAGEADARIALIGPSGAGKTTLLRLLAGAVPAAAGRVRVLGEEPARLAPRALRAFRGRVGFVHQQHALVPALRVVQNVAAGRLARHGALGGLRRVLLPRLAEAEEIHALLERVGVADHLYTRTDRLSGGEQQRVALARALHQDPALLLADEPVASVDPARARSVVALLVGLAEERGLPLVASLHDLELAREFFPRVVGLRAGRVVLDVRRGPEGWDDRLGAEAVAALYDLGDAP